jgi:hypothetical protein
VPTSKGMRTHTGFSERTKWMVTDRGGRLAMDLVYGRNEISSLRTAESSFGSIVLVGSYCQSMFSTFFESSVVSPPQLLSKSNRNHPEHFRKHANPKYKRTLA